jgi:hypothetical protein
VRRFQWRIHGGRGSEPIQHLWIKKVEPNIKKKKNKNKRSAIPANK